MKYYFVLQYRRLERRIRELGLPPVIGVILAVLFFAAGSKYLFIKTSFAGWIYALLGLLVLSALGEGKRNDLLRSVFLQKDYLVIRILENVLAILGFVSYLVYEGYYYIALGLFVLSIIIAGLHVQYRITTVVPTPFRKYPFEYIAGFRRMLWLVILAYFLLAKSIQVDNFNLGLFALALLFFNGMSYYAQPEDEYFVWIYSTDSRGFLRQKLLTALLCASLLSAPLMIALSVAYWANIWIILGVQLLGCIFLLAMILAKYSAYPGEINLAQAFLFGLSLWFPPMLLIVIPIFYKRSITQLKALLE